MPFTLSHAAAVLPAVRRDGTGRGPLVPAVLVAGSFAPDMTFYAANVLPGGMEFGTFTHAFAGVFTVDVLISWALVGLWLLVREPLTALLPRGLQGRPAVLLRCGAPRARVRAVCVVWWYVSAVLGALTHVVWDAFTHEGRWGTRLIPAIERDRPAGLPLFAWLQYGSSVVGVVVIAVFTARALRRGPGEEAVGGPTGAPPGVSLGAAPSVPMLSARDRWVAGVVIGGAAAAGAVQRAARSWAVMGAPRRLWDLVPALCFGAGAGLVLGVVLYAAGVRLWRPDRAPDGPAGPRGPGGPGGPGLRDPGPGDRRGVVGADRERPVGR
ncbi:DUF4184 family protein [Streptomyces alanosinicus]|uniref:DUF4184 family protein n=1 Tax=Streptomyces alanosinicus TaxID=68171 RepID=A0A919CZK1_9ACTN|nr:DUF4184 family protein [Streptomyces alanosinicus]GHD97704.1 hypothetical protein GCM10010339_01170 [Streptomyces alanosinicus]